MNLFTKLQQHDAANNRIRVGMIGAGKFGTTFLAQAIRLPASTLSASLTLIQLMPSNLGYVGWPDTPYCAASLDDAIKLVQVLLVMIGAPHRPSCHRFDC